MLIGPSLGYRVHERLTLGASVFVAYVMSSMSRSLYWGDHAVSASSYFRLRTFEALCSIGAQMQLTERWFTGLALTMPSLTLAGDGVYQQQASIFDDQTSEQIFVYGDGLDASYSLPMKATMGLGFREQGRYAAGLDVTYHAPASTKVLSGRLNTGEEGETVFHRNWVLDVNLGGELYVAKNYPVRAGFFTSQSAMRESDLGHYAIPSIDLYGLTASVAREARSVILELGVNYTFGKGRSFGWTELESVAPEREVVAREQNIYIFLNTSYMF